MVKAALAVVVLLALAVPNPARAGSINPLDKEAPPIPGDQGMEYFYGEWMPGQSPDALVFTSQIFHRGGHVTYEWWSPEDHTDDPPELFKVVAEDEKTVLLAFRFWNEIIDSIDYRFSSLTLRMYRSRRIPALYLGYCLDDNFGEAEWQMAPEKILAYFRKSRFCNPLLYGANEKYPWGKVEPRLLLISIKVD